MTIPVGYCLPFSLRQSNIDMEKPQESVVSLGTRSTNSGIFHIYLHHLQIKVVRGGCNPSFKLTMKEKDIRVMESKKKRCLRLGRTISQNHCVGERLGKRVIWVYFQEVHL